MKNWWQSLNERERRLVVVAGSLMLLALVYWGGWRPFEARLEQQRRQVASQQETLRWMAQQGARLASLRASTGSAPDLSGSLESVVNRTAQAQHITLTRLQAVGSGIQVEIEKVAFDSLLDWLTVLEQRHAVLVQALDLAGEEERKGMVKVRRLLLGRTE